MTSVNPYFTFSYVQPEEYHFSHDSVFLARRVFEFVLQENLPSAVVLDLCAGCGVVGIDYFAHTRSSQVLSPLCIDFVEVQSVYEKYFVQNIAQVQDLASFQFLTLNYDQVFTRPELMQKYDLILCNPPYFKKEMGILSESDFKNRCRFFIDSNFENLLRSIQYLLKPEGSAFVLLKDLKGNGHSLEREFRQLSLKMRWSLLEKIRGTDVYRFQLL